MAAVEQVAQQAQVTAQAQAQAAEAAAEAAEVLQCASRSAKERASASWACRRSLGAIDPSCGAYSSRCDEWSTRVTAQSGEEVS